MQYTLIVIFLNLLATPLLAQEMPPMEGPPPEIRAHLEQARSQTRTAVMNLLSADHRAKVQSVVDSFNAGNLSMCQAAEKIAGVLSPAESAQVLAQEQKMRESLGPPPPPMPPPGMPPQQMQPGPGAPPPHEMPPPHVEMHFVRMTGKHRPDAGEVVLMLSAIP